MPKIKPHPALAKLHDSTSDRPYISFSGFAAPGPKGVVRLCEDLTGRRYIEFHEDDVIDGSQDDKTGVTTLHVTPFSIVTAGSTVQTPLLTAFARQRPDGGPGGDGGTGKSCVQQRIDKCKKDPTVKDPNFCDSDDARNLFDVLCKIFGDPPKQLGGIVIA